LPNSLSPEAARELEYACLIGGPDNMPWLTEPVLQNDRLFLDRDVEESGALAAPWRLNGLGRFMVASGTLIERSSPYHFQVELARGKINHLRSQAAEWLAAGLQITPALRQAIRQATRTFSKAVTEAAPSAADPLAEAALVGGAEAAGELVRLYTEQMFTARHQRQPQLDTLLGCRLGSARPLPEAQAAAVLEACNSITLPLVWREIEPEKDEYHWEALDALVHWALDQHLSVSAGPLIDFSPVQVPPWVKTWSRDLTRFTDVCCSYLQAVLQRYRGRLRSWQLTSATNCTTAPWPMSEDEILWLTVRLGDAARQVDPNAALSVGISQPWGEYLMAAPHTHSPFIFADTLVRSSLNIAALDLELVMSAAPRGSYCRDLLDTSRLLDLYSMLGVPLRVTLGYPSSDQPDALADPGLRIGAGQWRDGYSPELQADWAERFAALALCKPAVRAVNWAHLDDGAPHLFPHCGLFDAGQQPKPALPRLQRLREQHLR
jgi:hypothetical protein